MHQSRIFLAAYVASMSLADKHFAIIEDRLADARCRIVQQYQRVGHAALEEDEVQLNAMVLVSMLLTFSFMLRYSATYDA